MEHRLLTTAGALALAALALLVAGAVTPTHSQQLVVRAQALEIVDAGGVARITLDAVAGKPAIWLYDRDRRRRVGVSIGVGDVPEVALLDQRGRPRLLLRAGGERAAELRVTDALGRPRLAASVDYRDDPGLWMYDELTRARIGLKVVGGLPRVWLFEDPSGRLIFVAP